MAAKHKLVILPLVFLLFLSSSESTRLLIGARAPPVRSALTKPVLGLALPGYDDAALTSFGRRSGAGARTSYSGRYFRQMFLNALPKGSVTPSGPSKGTNDSKV